MQYKKIAISLKSWYITPWESDTILWYIFTFWFLQDNQDIKDIFQDFVEWNLPFLITNWFVQNNENIFIPKPIFFSENKERKEINFKEGILHESDRKKFKKIRKIPFTKKALEISLTKKQLTNEEKQDLIKWNEKYEKMFVEDEVWKNMVPRFNIWETEPYCIKSNFTDEIAIYVKVFDKDKFKKFYSFMKNILENIWYWAWKSRGFGKVEKVSLNELTKIEKEAFDYIENLKKSEWLHIVLNNYKPTEEELENINIEESFIDINWKNTKTIYEINKKFFKWKMPFIKEWSVIKANCNLKGDFYKFKHSVNFWFIF